MDDAGLREDGQKQCPTLSSRSFLPMFPPILSHLLHSETHPDTTSSLLRKLSSCSEMTPIPPLLKGSAQPLYAILLPALHTQFPLPSKADPGPSITPWHTVGPHNTSVKVLTNSGRVTYKKILFLGRQSQMGRHRVGISPGRPASSSSSECWSKEKGAGFPPTREEG